MGMLQRTREGLYNGPGRLGAVACIVCLGTVFPAWAGDHPASAVEAVPPVPAVVAEETADVPESYEDKLRRLGRVLRQRKAAVAAAEAELHGRKTTLLKTDEKCGTLAREISQLETSLARKRDELNQTFLADDAVSSLERKVKESTRAVEQAKEDLFTAIRQGSGEEEKTKQPGGD